MESLAEAAEAAVGAAPQTQEEPVFEGATERDEACVIVGEKRARADAVTAMENKKEHLRRRLEKKIDLIEKAVAKSENKPLSTREATPLEKWRRDVDAMNMELAGLEKKSEEAVVRKAMSWPRPKFLRAIGIFFGKSNDHTADFVTTVRDPPCSHSPFSSMPSESSGDIRERGTFADAPDMSRYYDLKFICKGSERQFVTSMPADRILRSEDGDSLWKGGVFVAGRAPEQLPPVAVAALRECFSEMSDTGDFVIRGKGAANVCVDFVVTGVKCDLNTKMAMPHSTTSSDVHDAVAGYVNCFRV